MGTLIEAQVEGQWMFAVTNGGLRAMKTGTALTLGPRPR